VQPFYLTFVAIRRVPPFLFRRPPVLEPVWTLPSALQVTGAAWNADLQTEGAIAWGRR